MMIFGSMTMRKIVDNDDDIFLTLFPNEPAEI